VQVDIEPYIYALRVGIGVVPPVLIAIVLLGGPTASWLLYRFVVQPRKVRMRGNDRTAMWVCASCRSVNDLRMARCYRCDATPDEAELEVIDARPTGPIPLSPVGPGLDLGGHATAGGRPIARIERAPDVWDEDDAWPEEVAERRERVVRPDVAAMAEVSQAATGGAGSAGWTARPSGPIPVGPGRPSITRPGVARPRRAVVAGTATDPDDSPAA
jgi:hypothetical protein